ncbi:hypothetical protein SLE2022_027380 [Rubroshorea leprosula]
MADAETTKPATVTTTSTTAKTMPQPSKPTPRRFVGVRPRPSGRWVAEIKDSSQRIRLWLGTYDTTEEAARAYDGAAHALRGENARTNFATSVQNSSQPDSSSDGRHALSFSSLKAKLRKNLQSSMARSTKNKCSKSRVSDHFTFASLFRLRNLNYPYNNPVDMKNTEKVVQPSIIVPHAAVDDQPLSWDSSSVSDCSKEWMGFRQDSDGSDIGEGSFGNEQHGWFLDQMIAGWMDSPEIGPSSSVCDDDIGSTSKRFKVSSSVVVPPTFSHESPRYN